MPGQDRTGPNGEGPLTGRGLGPCGRGLNRGLRMGLGRGSGFGREFRFRRFAPVEVTEKEEKDILREELKAIEEDKKEIEKRLKELK